MWCVGAMCTDDGFGHRVIRLDSVIKITKVSMCSILISNQFKLNFLDLDLFYKV